MCLSLRGNVEFWAELGAHGVFTIDNIDESIFRCCLPNVVAWIVAYKNGDEIIHIPPLKSRPANSPPHPANSSSISSNIQAPPHPANFPSPPEDDKICCVCSDKSVEIMFLDCRHICACSECAVDLIQCPICRKVTEKVKVFFP